MTARILLLVSLWMIPITAVAAAQSSGGREIPANVRPWLYPNSQVKFLVSEDPARITMLSSTRDEPRVVRKHYLDLAAQHDKKFATEESAGTLRLCVKGIEITVYSDDPADGTMILVRTDSEDCRGS